MSFSERVFKMSKHGNSPDECEDAYHINGENHSFAIADGATDSAFQKLWAELLVKSFVEQPPPASKKKFKGWFYNWLKTQQTDWHNSIDMDTLPWHGFNKVQETGGVATFVGLQFFPDKQHWSSCAIGDSNLFYFSGKKYLSFPINQSAEFGINPVALSSIVKNYDKTVEHIRSITQPYQSGDCFILATDALAHWILAQLEQEKSIDALFQLTNQDQFERFVTQLRHEKAIRNDDTTLLIVEIGQIKRVRKKKKADLRTKIVLMVIFVCIFYWSSISFSYWLGTQQIPSVEEPPSANITPAPNVSITNTLLTNTDSMSTTTNISPQPITYTIKNKEPLNNIAKKYSVTVEILRETNQIPTNTHYLEVGTVITIPLCNNLENCDE